MVSITPAWLHKASAFAVVAVGSMAVWNWDGVVSTHTAAIIVSALGGAKFFLEFVNGGISPAPGA